MPLILSRLRGPLGVQIIGVLKLITAMLGMAVGLGLFRLFKGDVAASLEQVIRHLRLDPENRLVDGGDRRRIVSSVICDGEVIYADGRFTKVDRDARCARCTRI